MPFERQRFIHAANVRLDVPVSVHFTEQLTDELRHALEDATLAAFDQVVDACLDHKVDYLLLSGNVFLEADRSLRARLKLVQGCERLQEKNVPVFVLPGDADPPEAWRAIPELPSNVRICFSSSPEPEELLRDDTSITAVSASMWYGAADSFGIRVIGRSEDGVDPFRIGIVSRAKFDESRRMAALSSSGDEDLIQQAPDEASDPSDSKSSEPKSAIGRVLQEAHTTAEYEAAFRDYIGRLMDEGRLNYVAYMGELERLTISLEQGKVHCPGTTQPRNQLETERGGCSLVQVEPDGSCSIREVDTSVVDWKDIDLEVTADDTLNHCLQRMKNLLQEQPAGEADEIWSVRWTLRGPLPVLHDFLEEDLELAVAVELEEIELGKQKLRLVHEVRTLPDPWEVPDKESQAQEYADLITEDAIVSRRRLMKIVRQDAELTDGWRHRLEALVGGVDRERILSRMRVDGAHWFVHDIHSLVPDEDDFDEDILQDEAVEEFGLTSEGDEEETVAAVLEDEADDADSDTAVPASESTPTTDALEDTQDEPAEQADKKSSGDS
ncbi:MAG: hypothetical protein Fues2KO_51730 [Fuerstiella sp.]